MGPNSICDKSGIDYDIIRVWNQLNSRFSKQKTNETEKLVYALKNKNIENI